MLANARVWPVLGSEVNPRGTRIITGGIMLNFLFVAGTSINFAVLTGEYVTVNTTDIFQKNEFAAFPPIQIYFRIKRSSDISVGCARCSLFKCLSDIFWEL